MSDHRRRLAKVTSILAARGCPSCAGWDATVVQIVAPSWWGPGDGEMMPLPLERPERCPSCGRRAPQRTIVVQIVAPDDEMPEVAT